MKIFKIHSVYMKEKTHKRLLKIHQYFVANPGCTTREAETFIPETQSMVQKYSKNRGKFNDMEKNKSTELYNIKVM